MLRRSQALSLSLLLLAGCAAPTGAPTTAIAPAAPGPVVVSQLGEAPAQTATAPAAPAAPAAPSVPVTTLDGSVSYRGEALAGYTLQVRDAQSDTPVAVLADLSAAQGLAVGAGSLVTDAQGRFSLRVANLTAGTALRVTAVKDHVILETVLIGTPAQAGYAVQAAGDGLSITELSTAVARIARGLVRTTQVLTPQAAQPVLERLNARLQELMPKLEAELARMPESAQQLVNPPKQGEPLDTVVANAGLRQSLTQAAADLVAEVAKQAQADGNRAAAAADPAIQAQLAKIVLVGTMLDVGYDPTKNALGLVNRFTGRTADAAGDLSGVTRPPSNSRSNGPAFAEAFQKARLIAVDPRWTSLIVRLAPGLTPRDFKALEVDFYDLDDNKITTASADPTAFPLPLEDGPVYTIQETSERGYRMPIFIKRTWGRSAFPEYEELMNNHMRSAKSRVWNYEVPGLPHEAEVTLTLKDGGEPITYRVRDEKIVNIDPLAGGSFGFSLRETPLADVATATVRLLDRRDRVVASSTYTAPADVPLMEAYSVLQDIVRPDRLRVTFRPVILGGVDEPNWAQASYTSVPVRAVLRFTDHKGHAHTRDAAIPARNYEGVMSDLRDEDILIR
jgi:hypothetical protein